MRMLSINLCISVLCAHWLTEGRLSFNHSTNIYVSRSCRPWQSFSCVLSYQRDYARARRSNVVAYGRSTMNQARVPVKSCHNCRQQRRRCDRAWPSCLKCSALGQECLGYGARVQWTNSVASRGKLMGKTYDLPCPRSPKQLCADKVLYGGDQEDYAGSAHDPPLELSKSFGFYLYYCKQYPFGP